MDKEGRTIEIKSDDMGEGFADPLEEGNSTMHITAFPFYEIPDHILDQKPKRKCDGSLKRRPYGK